MPRSVPAPAKAGDGSTSTDVDETVRPTLQPWEPRERYEIVQISTLVPGSGRVCLLGRVVNLYEPPAPNKMPRAAHGCLKFHIRDDSGTIMVSQSTRAFKSSSDTVQVKLWFAKVDYQLRLGQLVSVWTTHISHAELTEGNHPSVQTASYATAIFPEHDRSCYIVVQEVMTDGELFRAPLGYNDDKQLTGLVTLKSFINGGHEVPNVKVLICVKSIGGRKKCIRENSCTRFLRKLTLHW